MTRAIAWAVGLVLVIVVGVALAQSMNASVSRGSLGAAAFNGWQTVKIGGGGYLTGIDISPDGLTRCVRTDTYGAYCRNAGDTAWVQIMTVVSMPTGSFSPGGSGTGVGTGMGVYELRVAPSLSSRLYMARGGSVFRSDNRGATWARTGFVAVNAETSMNANDDARYAGEKLAIDPQDPNVVFVGTTLNGLWRTVNGGKSWTQVATVPTTGRIAGFAFATGEAADGRTDVMWVGSAAPGAAGVYKSTDQGVTFSLLTGGPNGDTDGVWHGAAKGSTYYVTAGNLGASKLWRNTAGSWTDCTKTGSVISDFALDPLTDRLVASNESSQVFVSDHGSTCTPTNWQPDYFYNTTLSCPDAPWLCQAVQSPTVGLIQAAMKYDPVVANRVWMAGGVAPWFTALPASFPNITWTSQAAGIEQLCANTVLVPPSASGVPVTASWDFGLHRLTNPNAYQTDFAPTPHQFGAAWHVDYASNDPNFLVAIVCWGDGPSRSSTSTDGGATWTPFPSMPVGASCENTWGKGGTVAAASATNWIWVSSGGKAPYRTTDGGSTWSKLVIPGIADNSGPSYDSWRGLHENFFLNRHIVTADRVLADTFYLAHYTRGIFRSTDKGATWTRMHGPLLNDIAFNDTGFNATLKSVPGKPGHLFFTSGQQDGATNPSPTPFYRSVDGGANWTKIPKVKEVYAFGFGRVVASYPTIYIVGWVSGAYGVWKSVDQGASWTRLGPEYALDSFDQASTIDGDKNGDRVFIGFRGSGYAYFSPAPPQGSP